MDVYAKRRLGALIVLVLLLVGVVSVARAVLGGDDDAPPRAEKPAKRRAPRPAVKTDPASMAKRANVPVLCWHQVRPFTAADTASARPYIVTAKTLDRQLGALRRAGYQSVSTEQYAAHVTKGAKLPTKPVVLTFDDGTIGQYTRALPLLKKHGMTATFFPMTVVLGKKDWFTAKHIRALDKAGMSIGVHTWDHHDVSKLSTDEDWQTQFVEPKAELERILGRKVTMFAYPFGIWSPSAFPHLRESGFSAAFQLSDGLDEEDPQMTLRRIIVPTMSGGALLAQIKRDF